MTTDWFYANGFVVMNKPQDIGFPKVAENNYL
jgi:hypothetical protein